MDTIEAYPLLSPGSGFHGGLNENEAGARAELYPETETEGEYLLTTSAVRISQRRGERLPKMAFFDNLRGWDKFKVYRYIILLALSLSGDGWYVHPHTSRY